jgi:alanyl-tRNA synthetase
VAAKKVKREQNIHHAAQHLLNAATQVKVKNGVKQNK